MELTVKAHFGGGSVEEVPATWTGPHEGKEPLPSLLPGCRTTCAGISGLSGSVGRRGARVDRRDGTIAGRAAGPAGRAGGAIEVARPRHGGVVLRAGRIRDLDAAAAPSRGTVDGRGDFRLRRARALGGRISRPQPRVGLHAAALQRRCWPASCACAEPRRFLSSSLRWARGFSPRPPRRRSPGSSRDPLRRPWRRRSSSTTRS